MSFTVTEIINSVPPFYIAVAVILVTTLYYRFKTRGIPPGPVGVPYLGLWTYLNPAECHLQLQEMAKKYGDVFSFTYVGRLYIHLGSVKAVREAHTTNAECFPDRLDDFHTLRFFLDGGVVYLKGEPWRVVRKFFLQQFRERGMNVINQTLSGSMYDTIRETVDDLKKCKGQSVDIASILLSKCNKIMRETLLGGDGMTEKEMREYNEHYFASLMQMSSTGLLLSGNFSKYVILPLTKGFRESKKGHLAVKKMLYKVINERKATFDESNIRDCIDGFLKEKNIRQSKNDPMAKYFTDEILMVSLIQFIGDGVLFMAMFIGAFIKALLDHPEEQEKIYQELKEVTGLDRNPEMEDKSKLTYTNAFISEVVRTTDVFTVFPSMECIKDATVSGYRIPKGAVTLYNFWAAHMNPKDYDEPEKFNPSRFIVKEGEKRPDLLTMFGVGKRACMGEGFAMIQVFLFLTTIVKNFRLTRPVEGKKNSALFFCSDTLDVCAHPRN